MFSCQAAYWIWQAASLAALAGFVTLWTLTPRRLTMAVTCSLAPALISCLINGQDVFFLLLWIGLAARLLCSDRPIAAGLVLSLCLQKYNLFALAPLWIIGQRRWRVGAGLAAGVAGLLAVSFAVAGRSWPLEYFKVGVSDRFELALFGLQNRRLDAAPADQQRIRPVLLLDSLSKRQTAA